MKLKSIYGIVLGILQSQINEAVVPPNLQDNKTSKDIDTYKRILTKRFGKYHLGGTKENLEGRRLEECTF